jgi:hypothetical protein
MPFSADAPSFLYRNNAQQRSICKYPGSKNSTPRIWVGKVAHFYTGITFLVLKQLG